jgi:hypothetical protein
MQKHPLLSVGVFKNLFTQMLAPATLDQILNQCGVRRRRPPAVAPTELLCGLVFHALAGKGTFSQHMKEATDQELTDGALSQRRAKLSWNVFQLIMKEALKPKADATKHPQAFYRGLRLCGVDGSRFSMTNSPQLKETMTKPESRRGPVAFPQMGAVVLVELGLHNPIAAAVGMEGESEMVLAKQVLESLPAKSLLIGDRYYGVPEVLHGLARQGREFLVRVRDNIKSAILESYPDGSALVEIGSGKSKVVVREILAEVGRENGPASPVRLWTSLVDWREHKVEDLLGLYGRRWEQEIFFKELKVDTRSTEQLRSHTVLTAAQEIAALVLAYTVLVDHRIAAAEVAEVGVLRISFGKTLQVLQGLWSFLELSADLLGPKKVAVVVQRALEKISQWAIPKRRQRSCPRAVRQPVSSWPRLMKNTSQESPITYKILPTAK